MRICRKPFICFYVPEENPKLKRDLFKLGIKKVFLLNLAAHLKAKLGALNDDSELDYDFFYLQETLCVLRVDHNNIDHITDLSVLKELRHFSAADNKLHSMGVSEVLDGRPFAASGVFSRRATLPTQACDAGPSSPSGLRSENIVP